MPVNELSNIADFYYGLDHVALTTIGIDVGSSTFHALISKVQLERELENISSRFKVISRDTLWHSPIELTPYRGRYIDATAVSKRISEGYQASGLTSDDIDSGAVIFTGEALRRRNARSLAELLAADTGKFVCVSAGHHLEAQLAAFGSGALQTSQLLNARVLHVDIGGGTTKIAAIDPDGIRQTAAILGGGRLVAWSPDRTITRISAGARMVANLAGVPLALGTSISEESVAKLVGVLSDVILGAIGARDIIADYRRFRLTPKIDASWIPQYFTFSGGVSEYIYGRETRNYHDLGEVLGNAVRDGILQCKEIPLVDPGQGIRATVIGASQSSLQLSGSTVFVSNNNVLPIRNIPVVHVPNSFGRARHSPEAIAGVIIKELETHGQDLSEAFALSLSWNGEFLYEPLRDLVAGIQLAIRCAGAGPVVILLEEDIGASVGRMLDSDFPLDRPLICLDGLDIKPFDHVDIGSIIEPSGVLPVVIKSLLFDH